MPETVAVITATAVPGGIRIAITTPADSGDVGLPLYYYDLQRSPNPDQNYDPDNEPDTPEYGTLGNIVAGDFPYTDFNFGSEALGGESGVTFTYKVTPVWGSIGAGELGNGSDSNEPTAIPLTPDFPDPPEAGTQTPAEANDVPLTWAAVPGATSYDLYRGATLIHSGPETSYTDTNVPEATYNYSIIAHVPIGAAASGSTSVEVEYVAPAGSTTIVRRRAMFIARTRKRK